MKNYSLVIKTALSVILLVELGNTQMIMYIDPPRIPPKVVGQQCTITVRMRNAYGIYTWQAGLLFNKDVLNGASIIFSNADSLIRYAYGVSHSVFNVSGSWNNTNGILTYCGGTQMGIDSGGIGDGPLMKLVFNVVGTGSSILDLTQASGNARAYICDTMIRCLPFICQDGFYGDEAVTPTTSKGISLVTGHQTRPSVAYNSTNSEFLTVWEDGQSGPASYYIRGRRISAGGDTLGSVINIQTADSAHALSPNVSWNGTRYMVVWTNKAKRSYDYNINGKTMSADGITIGSLVNICSAVRYQGNPAIAWNGTYHLVVWNDAQNSYQLPRIYGQRLDASGSPQGSNFSISANDGYYHLFPRVATNNNEFLVVWVDNCGGGDSQGRIRAQRVSSAGSLLGSVIAVTSGSGSYLDVAWDTTNYLVVYQRATSSIVWDIYGRRVSSTGSLLGSEFAINTAANDQTMARVIYEKGSGRYLVVWETDQNLPAIYSQRVNPEGTLFGTAVLQADASYHQVYPAIASGSYYSLLGWADLRGGANFDVYGNIIYEPIPPKSPYITKGEKNSSNLKLYWNRVTQDTLGNMENLKYYVVYRDTSPSFIPDPTDSIGAINSPDTSFTNIGVLNDTKSYYYLVVAADSAKNKSKPSNTAFKFNKFLNENPDRTD